MRIFGQGLAPLPEIVYKHMTELRRIRAGAGAGDREAYVTRYMPKAAKLPEAQVTLRPDQPLYSGETQSGYRILLS